MLNIKAKSFWRPAMNEIGTDSHKKTIAVIKANTEKVMLNMVKHRDFKKFQMFYLEKIFRKTFKS